MKPNDINKAIISILLVTFVGASLYGPQAQAGEVIVPVMPQPGTKVDLSPNYNPAYLKGIVIHPDNALQFDFLINKGDGNLTADQKRQEYNKLIKYFLASLTTPDKDQWVNLSPYEKERTIQDDFGKTEMGRDLLSQDYLLKQITSSLMYPESQLGKSFWNKVYERAYKEYGHTNIPVNTFNKVWIIPDEATVYESGNTAYVVKNHLKVMLEEDYLAMGKNTVGAGLAPAQNNRATARVAPTETHTVASQVIRDIILPQIEKEVNEGKNFAMLRQIYSGMLLATWYKKALKESLLGKVYADKAKVKGVDQPACRQAGIRCEANEVIYQKYLAAFKKGVYNYIKEDVDQYTQQNIPRKYFAGGAEQNYAQMANFQKVNNEAMVTEMEPGIARVDLAAVSLSEDRQDSAEELVGIGKLSEGALSDLNTYDNNGNSRDAAMTGVGGKESQDKAMLNKEQAKEYIKKAYWALRRAKDLDIKTQGKASNAIGELIKEARDLIVQLSNGNAWKLWAYLMAPNISLANKEQWALIVSSLKELNDNDPLAEPGESNFVMNKEINSEDEIPIRLLSVIMHFKQARIFLTNADGQKQQVSIRRRDRGIYFINPLRLPGALEITNFGSDKGFIFGIERKTGRFMLINEVKRTNISVEIDGKLLIGVDEGKERNFSSEMSTHGANITISFARTKMHLRYQDGALYLSEPFRIPVKKVFVFHIIGGKKVLKIDLPFSDYDNLGFLSFEEPLQFLYTPLEKDRAMGSSIHTNPGGIDMNSANLAMTIKRDGKGVPLPLAQQDLAQLSHIQGFVPNIIEIRPAATLPIFSKLQHKVQL